MIAGAIPAFARPGHEGAAVRALDGNGQGRIGHHALVQSLSPAHGLRRSASARHAPGLESLRRPPYLPELKQAIKPDAQCALLRAGNARSKRATDTRNRELEAPRAQARELDVQALATKFLQPPGQQRLCRARIPGG